jgi:hypothetical protein
MSIATLDYEIAIEEKSFGSVDELSSGTKTKTPQQVRSSDNMLWGFDEVSERQTFDRIRRRLIRLESALFEEFGSRIDQSSQDCLLRFFVAYPTVRQPLISASPNGVLTATWRGEGGEELVIRCAAPDAVHYALTCRAVAGSPVLNRQWGTDRSPALFFTQNESARRLAE